LRYWRLIEVHQPAGRTLGRSALRADDRIVDFSKGLNYLDDRLLPLLLPGSAADPELLLAGSQKQVAEALKRQIQAFAFGQRPPVVQLVGPDAVSQRLVAAVTAKMLGLGLLRMPAEALPQQAGELENLARMWQRESLLLPLALLIEAHESDAHELGSSPLLRFIARNDGALFVSLREALPKLDRTNVVAEVSRPFPSEQHDFWVASLAGGPAANPEQLAGQFDLNLPAIEQATRAARALEDDQPVEARLWAACRALTRPRLEALAKRIDAKATWEEIVLPQEALALLRHLADQVRQRRRVYDEWGFRARMNRGFGISALFAGDSGSGKTMAAEVIANDLRLDLYRVDLSAVVSKYIGETEKNLRRVFDAAEDGGAILFFDEADALFGKRSEVRDSHDRYANIEINYLLQRMEAYRGLAILATNLKQALDTAFLRRLRFVVNFPFPGAAERKQIWQRVFPVNTPLEALDLDRLARWNLTGGSIHNIALNAAFLAARHGRAVTMQEVLEAARIEMRKLDQPVNESDFVPARPKVVSR
jgi:hypothetical protein